MLLCPQKTASLVDAVLFSANAVLAALLDFVGGDAATVLHIVLHLTHAQIEQIVTAYFLAM